QVLIGALGEIFANNHDRGARGTEILLRAGENQAKFFDIHLAGRDVGRHVRDQGYGASFGKRLPLGAFDGVVTADVDVGSVRREAHLVVAWNAREFFRLGGSSDVVENPLLELAQGLGGPGPGVKQIDGLAGQAKVHGNHSELHASAALEENDRVFAGNSQMLAKTGFG